MDSGDLQAVLAIARAVAALDEAAFAPVLSSLRVQDVAVGQRFIAQGDADPPECFVLHGIAKSGLGDAQGREVTLAFHVGPCTLTPSIARVADGRSRVDCVALTPLRVASFAPHTLLQCMLADPGVQRWGDTVLRAELVRRADREWALAALPAAERLLQLRQQHPGLEDRVAHHHIASYLGVTPVTLSRLRAQLRRSHPHPATPPHPEGHDR